jgi:amino-acid N-acetyltransferase
MSEPIAAERLRALHYDEASAADLDAIRRLLEALHLPAADVGNPNQAFIVARDGGELAGCVGLEDHGEDMLLRSLAVTPERQGAGIGMALHARALEEAVKRRKRALYLLTTTAEAFFARAGFTRIERTKVPAAVAASAEFRSLCPASAVCMMRELS